MRAMSVSEPIAIGDFAPQIQSLASDVVNGLSAKQKSIPPKYFYDYIGSELFERICGLPEYYPTRTERSILAGMAPQIIERLRPSEIVEFGSGSARKTELLLAELNRVHKGGGYFIPIDISANMLEETAERLLREFPGLEIYPIVADFNVVLPTRRTGDRPRLVLFLGGTVGNLDRDESIDFLSRLANNMLPQDRLLLGIDLVKDPAVLHAAYNDASGVTAAFNRNVLAVINRDLGGHFDLSSFGHYAFYNPHAQQIEMHLASLVEQTVEIDALGMRVAFARGETILTEVSRKFSRRSITKLLAAGGLRLEEFHTDPQELFALCVASIVV